MKKILNKKFIIFLSIISLTFLIFSLIYKPQTPSPQLLISSPTQNARSSSLTDPIQLKFDQPIDPSLLTISSIPAESWSIESGLDNNSITLKSKQYLRVDTNYSLSIVYKNIQITTLNFKTMTQQGDPRYTQEVLSELERDYPLAAKTPLTTSQYRVVYSSPMTLEITLKNSNLTSAEVIDEVKSWVTKNGGDSIAHKYVIARAPAN